MKKHIPMLKGMSKNQSGINMVDLMMWLVIAALLLAAALQGIGYYQKSAYLYQMKSDTLHAAEAVTAKVANTDGKFTPEAVTAGTDDTAKTAEITITPDPGASDSAGYVLRTAHAAIPDKDVLFLSKQRGTYGPGVHVVPKGTVIGVDGGTTVVPPGGGGETGGEDGGATFTPIVNNASDPVEAVYLNRINTEIAAYATPEYLTYWEFGIATEWADWEGAVTDNWMAYEATPAGAAYENGARFTVLQQQVYNSMTQQTAGGVNDLYNAYSDAESTFMATPTAETQQAMVTALENLYRAAVSTPLPDGLTMAAAPSYPGNFGTINVAAGSTSDVTLRYALPASVATYTQVTSNSGNWAVNTYAPSGFDGYGSSFSTVTQNDSGTAYWEGVVRAPSGGWTAGTHVATVSVKNQTTKYIYVSEITIKVQ